MTLGQRFMRFWITYEVYHYLLTRKVISIKAPEEPSKVDGDKILEICERVAAVAFSRGLTSLKKEEVNGLKYEKADQ